MDQAPCQLESKVLVRKSSSSYSVDPIGVDYGGVKNPEKEGHPCSEDSELGVVIGSELVTEVDTIHVMVVVIDHLGDFEFCCGLAIKYCTSPVSISTGFAWVTSNSCNEVLLFISDAVDGGEHGDRCIVHPYNGKNLVVDHHSR